MPWFSSHNLLAFQKRDAIGPITVYENIYLIFGNDYDEALDVAKKLSNFERDCNKDLYIDDLPATCIAHGVRKISPISDLLYDSANFSFQESIELSYIEYECNTIDQVRLIIDGGSEYLKFIG